MEATHTLARPLYGYSEASDLKAVKKQITGIICESIKRKKLAKD
jgi:hypothetical protein